jgi:hypothetical protein
MHLDDAFRGGFGVGDVLGVGDEHGGVDRRGNWRPAWALTDFQVGIRGKWP